MHESVSRYVRGCLLCARSKPSNQNLGLYTPLLFHSHPWESISMDFVGGLPMSKKNHDYLYVVVDQFRKMCIFMPCKKRVTAEQMAQMFFQHVWVHFGLPKSIISDRDSRFVGSFWSSLWALMDTKLKKRTTFHPQTDGQTKVVIEQWCFFFVLIAASILNFGMSIYTTFNMLTIELSTLQLKRRHLKHVLAICPNLL